MIYVCYQPDAPGSTSGPIVQFTSGATVNPVMLPWPSVEDPDGPRDYKSFKVVDGQIVPKE
ncbi:MAG: hypothetical protein NVV72_01020 [Asticcacaulis sp.]|nr:hypothetical protein [Asticcacaulis sp.]